MRIKMMIVFLLLALQGCASITKRQMIEECREESDRAKCDKHLEKLGSDNDIPTLIEIAIESCTYRRVASNCVSKGAVFMEAGDQFRALMVLRFGCEELNDKISCGLVKDIRHGMDAQAKRGYPVIHPVQFTMPDNSGIWQGVAGMVGNMSRPNIQEMPRMPSPTIINVSK